MASKAKMGGTIALDGEKEYKQAISNINKDLQVLTSELKKNASAFGDNSNSVEALSQRNNDFNKQIDAQKEKVAALEKALSNAKTQYGENATKTKEWQISLNKAQTDLNNMNTTMSKYQKELQNASSSSEEAEQASNELNNANGNLIDTIMGLASQFGINLPSSVTSAASSFGNFGMNADTATAAATSGVGNVLAGFGSLIGSLGAAIGLVVAFGAEAASTALKLENMAASFEASLGVSVDMSREMANAVKSIFNTAIAGSEEEITATMKKAKLALQETGDALYVDTYRAQVLAQAYGQSGTDIISAVDAMVDKFGITTSEAFEALNKGLQSSANEGGNLASVIEQYSMSFQRVGYSAQDMLDVLVASAEQGSADVGAIANAYDRFFESITSGNTDTLKGLNNLGLSSSQISRQITSGGEDAKNALELIITRLENIGDKTRQETIAQELFGRAWKETGTQELLALNDSNSAWTIQYNNILQTENALKTSTTSAQSFGKSMVYSDFQNSIWNLPAMLSSLSKLFDDQKEDNEQTGYNTGEDYIGGIANGITNNTDTATAAAREAARKIDEAARAELDEHSPSKKGEQVGKFYAQGLGIGVSKYINEMQDQVKSALSNVSNMQSIQNVSNTSYTSGDTIINVNGIEELNQVLRAYKGIKSSARARG